MSSTSCGTINVIAPDDGGDDGGNQDPEPPGGGEEPPSNGGGTTDGQSQVVGVSMEATHLGEGAVEATATVKNEITEGDGETIAIVIEFTREDQTEITETFANVELAPGETVDVVHEMELTDGDYDVCAEVIEG